jgi:hypothetical protein
VRRNVTVPGARSPNEAELVMLAIGASMLFTSKHWDHFCETLEMTGVDGAEEFKELHDSIMMFYIEVTADNDKLREYFQPDVNGPKKPGGPKTG